MTLPRVFLTGGDGIGWAIDEDLKLIRLAVDDIVELTPLPESEVVHSVWWEGLTMFTRDQLLGKRIVCHVSGEPFRYFALPAHRSAFSMVGRWITRTSQAWRQMNGVGVESALIPYLIDTHTFRPLPKEAAELDKLRARWQLPTDAYLIGSFQRDTEGSDLRRPKLVKGPDVLLETLITLRKRGLKFHLVLAGPRRHWLIGAAQNAGIPFTYIGAQVEGDDIDRNSVPRSVLNLLYNIVDLYVVASRSEGGPHAILEAGASRCKIISAPVGLAEDVLEPRCIFRSPPDAAGLIENDIAQGFLDSTVNRHYERVTNDHRPESVAFLFAEFYEKIDSAPRFTVSHEKTRPISLTDKDPSASRAPESKESSSKKLTVGLWHTFFEPPYGGGNQFMLALRKALLKRDVDVRENELQEGIDTFILNSIHFDVDRFLDFSRDHRLNVVHRIDGPIFLIRGFDRDKDELTYRLNAQFAAATVLQSAWCWQRIVDMGYKPVNPVIIHNAVDAEIFHSAGRIPFDRNRKTRLISTSWSNNPRKGGPTYKWIEEHLDWDRFEYTFVGNVSETFTRVRHIPPVSSEELAKILRAHDIYITASRNDPCSNALIEALACGLPALYLNDGGHPELVGYGGLPFNDESEILPQLEKLTDNYETFQRLIVTATMEDVAEKYLAVIREVVK